MQSAREELLRGLGFLSLVHVANEQAGRKLQQAEFYSPDLCDSLNLQHEYVIWVQFQVQLGPLSQYHVVSMDAMCTSASLLVCPVPAQPDMATDPSGQQEGAENLRARLCLPDTICADC